MINILVEQYIKKILASRDYYKFWYKAFFVLSLLQTITLFLVLHK